MPDTTNLLTMAEAAGRTGIPEKKFRRWAMKRGNVLLVGASDRQHVTVEEADAIAALMQPRRVAS